MSARYFLVSENEDSGAWLVDVEQATVQRVDETLASDGKSVPEGDLIANLMDLRNDRNMTIVQGVSLAIAAKSMAGPSTHSRREGGDVH